MIFLSKVDFFWINRDQRSFEWFINLLSQLEIEQASEMGGAMERFLDMHMYMTSALQRTDMRAVGLELALDLLHEKVGLIKDCHMALSESRFPSDSWRGFSHFDASTLQIDIL